MFKTNCKYNLSLKQTEITQLNKDNSQLSTEVREYRKQLNNAESKVLTLESQLSASEEKASVTALTVAKLVSAEDRSLQKTNDLIEQQELMERAFKAIEIELIITKTELSVKNQLLDTITGKLRPEGHIVEAANQQEQ